MNSFIPGKGTRLPNEMSIDRSAAKWERPTANAKFHLAAVTGKRQSLPKRCLDTAACDKRSLWTRVSADQDSTPPRLSVSQSPSLPRTQFYLCKCRRQVKFIPGILLDCALILQPSAPPPNPHTEVTVHVSMLASFFYFNVCLLQCRFILCRSN